MIKLFSIRWRLVASYVLLTLITVGVIGVLALSVVKQYVEQQERDYLISNAEAVARQAWPAMWPVVHHFELQELAQTSSFLGNARVRIMNLRREVLADSGPRAEAQEFVWVIPSDGLSDRSVVMMLPPDGTVIMPLGRDGQAAQSTPAGTRYTIVRRVETAWGSRLVFGVATERLDAASQAETGAGQKAALTGTPPRSQHVVSAPIGDAEHPVGYVELSGGPDFGAEAMSTARRAFLLAGGGAALLAVGVGLLVSHSLASPLRRLTAAAGQMSSGDLSARVSLRSRDEIGQLAGQFNRMAERLEKSFAELSAERDALRRFIADASHELRTPITALRTFNELLRNAAADDPPARAEFLAESQAQLDRLERITHNLLDLSRLDAGLIDLELADHDANDLIEGVAGAFRVLAGEKNVSLVIEKMEPGVRLRCDRVRIESALSNLVDNALKFTPAGGEVRLGAALAGPVVRLWVRDTGPGIDPADLPHIFERFYRGKNSPTRGSGLGLAIVYSVVQAHGGRVCVESELGHGSQLAIELPADGTA